MQPQPLRLSLSVSVPPSPPSQDLLDLSNRAQMSAAELVERAVYLEKHSPEEHRILKEHCTIEPITRILEELIRPLPSSRTKLDDLSHTQFFQLLHASSWIAHTDIDFLKTMEKKLDQIAVIPTEQTLTNVIKICADFATCGSVGKKLLQLTANRIQTDLCSTLSAFSPEDQIHFAVALKKNEASMPDAVDPFYSNQRTSLCTTLSVSEQYKQMCEELLIAALFAFADTPLAAPFFTYFKDTYFKNNFCPSLYSIQTRSLLLQAFHQFDPSSEDFQRLLIQLALIVQDSDDKDSNAYNQLLIERFSEHSEQLLTKITLEEGEQLFRSLVAVAKNRTDVHVVASIYEAIIHFLSEEEGAKLVQVIPLESLGILVLYFPEHNSLNIFLNTVQSYILQNKIIFQNENYTECISALTQGFSAHEIRERELYDFFEEYIIQHQNNWLQLPDIDFQVNTISAFLSQGYGSKRLLDMIEERLLDFVEENVLGIQNIGIDTLSTFVNECKATERGSKIFFKAVGKEIVRRLNNISDDDLQPMLLLIHNIADLKNLRNYQSIFLAFLDTYHNQDRIQLLPPEKLLMTAEVLRIFQLNGMEVVEPAIDPAIDSEQESLQTLLLQEFFRPCASPSTHTTILEHLSQEYFTRILFTVPLFAKKGLTNSHQFLSYIEKFLLEKTNNEQHALNGLPPYLLSILHIAFIQSGCDAAELYAMFETDLQRQQPDGKTRLASLTVSHLARYAHALHENLWSTNTHFMALVSSLLAQHGIQAFHTCMNHKSYTIANLLLSDNFNFSSKLPATGETVLHIAVKANYLEFANTILSAHPELVHVQDKQRALPLHTACELKLSEWARTLMRYNAGRDAACRNTAKKVAFDYLDTWDKNELDPFLQEVFGAFGAVQSYCSLAERLPFIQYFVTPAHAAELCDTSRNQNGANPLEIAYFFQNEELSNALRRALGADQFEQLFIQCSQKYGKKALCFLSTFIKNDDEDRALRHIDRDIDSHDLKELFIKAMFLEKLKIMQKLLTLGVLANHHFTLGGTPLHFACTIGSLDMFHMLVRHGADPARVNSEGKTPLRALFDTLNPDRTFILSLLKEHPVVCRFVEQFGCSNILQSLRVSPLSLFEGNANPFELAHLLQDGVLSSTLHGCTTEAQAEHLINRVQQKYPQSCLDLIRFSKYALDIRHLQRAARPPMPPPPRTGNIRNILTLFERIKEDMQREANDQNIRDMQEVLTHDFVDKIEQKRPYMGTPPANTPELAHFYENIQTACIHTVQRLIEIGNRALQVKTVMEYVRAAPYCGGRIQKVAIEQYDLVVRGARVDLPTSIYEELGVFRKLLLDSLIPANDQSVHIANQYFYAMARELQLPNQEAVFVDRLAQNINVKTLREQFYSRYTPRAIIADCIYPLFAQEGEFREQAIDWFKAHLPATYEKARFDAIKERVQQHVGAEAERAQVVRALQAEDVYMTGDQTIEQAIEAAKVDHFLSNFVVEDMTSPSMRIRKEACAFLLQQLGIIMV